MDFTNLKEAVAAVIKTNGNQEITGAVLQNVLNTIITTMGTGRTFVGVATPTTTAINPLPDGNVFYITKGYGSFADFNITVPQGEIYIIQNTATGWQGISLMKSPDALVSEIARQELTMPALLQVGAATGSGAENQGGTLVIPVGYSGNGSNAGAQMCINTDFGITPNTQVEDCTVVGLVQITGNQTEIDAKIAPFTVEFWTTPGGVNANLINVNFLSFEKLSDNIFMTVAHTSGVTAKKAANGNTFNGIYAGITVGSGNVTQEMRITPLAASHYSARLVDSQPEQLGNKVVKKLIGDALTDYNFSPPFTDAEYLLNVHYAKGYEANNVTLGLDINGKVYATCPANGNPYGFNIGMTMYILQPGISYRLRALYKNEGFSTGRMTFYFIYYNSAGRQIEYATATQDADGYLTITRDITPTEEIRIDLFGFQHTGSTPYSADAKITLLDMQVVQSFVNNPNTLTNALTQSIIAWIKAQNYGTSLRTYSENWRTDLFGDCVARAGNNGFTCPAGGTINPSNTVLNASGFRPGFLTNWKIYFRCSEIITGLRLFYITYNGGVRQVAYQSFIQDTADPDVTDRYYCQINVTPPADNSGSFDWALQATSSGITPTQDFYIYWEQCSWEQTYDAGITYPSAMETAIENLVVDAVNGAIGTGQPTTIVVSADPNDTDSRVRFKGKNAIQNALDSITDNSPAKRYRIYVKQGLYKITNSSEFLGWLGYPCMILMKDYVDIEGADRDGTIVWAELPYNDADIDVSANGQQIARNMHQTLWNYAKDAYMKHITLVAKNLRYTIHQDDGRSAMYNRGYEDVNVIFVGDKGSLMPWGLGSWNGETNEVKGGRTVASVAGAWACHNNTNFQYPTKWRFENHTFITENSKLLFRPQSDGSLINDFLELVGCSWGGVGYVLDYVQFWLRGDGNNASFDHAEWRIIGYGNDPFLFQNTEIRGDSLRIVSKSTGVNSKVRFGASGDVYANAIKNPRQNADVSLYLPETLYTDGYIVRDGSPGLSGWANGCVDLSEEVYAYNAGVNYTRFGLRLGDCSTTNKTLTINIDGTDYNVVFDKDYTDMTNAAILAEINAVISAVATATFVYYGRSYYPEMPDVSEIVYNASTTDYIPKGTVLKKVSGRVSPANDGDIIAGVALDDIPVFTNEQGVVTGTGRMLKRGYISTDGNQPFFVKAWNGTNTNVAIGDRLKVDAGRLVVDPAGTVTVKDTNVVAINCN